MAEGFSYFRPQGVRSADLLAEVIRQRRGLNQGLAAGISSAGASVERGLARAQDAEQRRRLMTMQQEAALELMKQREQSEIEAGRQLGPAIRTIAEQIGIDPQTGDALGRMAEQGRGTDARILLGQAAQSVQQGRAIQADAARREQAQALRSAGMEELQAAIDKGYLDEDQRATFEARMEGAESMAQLQSVLGDIGRSTRSAKEKAGVMRERDSSLKDLRKQIRLLADPEMRQKIQAQVEVLEGSTASPAEWAKQYDALARQVRGIVTLPGMAPEVKPPPTRSSAEASLEEPFDPNEGAPPGGPEFRTMENPAFGAPAAGAQTEEGQGAQPTPARLEAAGYPAGGAVARRLLAFQDAGAQVQGRLIESLVNASYGSDVEANARTIDDQALSLGVDPENVPEDVVAHIRALVDQPPAKSMQDVTEAVRRRAEDRLRIDRNLARIAEEGAAKMRAEIAKDEAALGRMKSGTNAAVSKRLAANRAALAANEARSAELSKRVARGLEGYVDDALREDEEGRTRQSEYDRKKAEAAEAKREAKRAEKRAKIAAKEQEIADIESGKIRYSSGNERRSAVKMLRWKIAHLKKELGE